MCESGRCRPTTWSCHAVMNQCNTGQRVRAASVDAASVVWWCGRSSGAGEVSQILAARKDGCRSAKRAVQTALREPSRTLQRVAGQRQEAQGRQAGRQTAGEEESEGKASRSARRGDPRAWKRERRFRSLAGWWPLLLPTAPPEVPNLLAVLTGMASRSLHCGHAANECIGSSQSAI